MLPFILQRQKKPKIIDMESCGFGAENMILLAMQYNGKYYSTKALKEVTPLFEQFEGCDGNFMLRMGNSEPYDRLLVPPSVVYKHPVTNNVFGFGIDYAVVYQGALYKSTAFLYYNGIVYFELAYEQPTEST